MNRREFAQRLALAASCLPMAGSALKAFADPPPVAPTPSGSAVSAPSFYQKLADNDADLAAINPKQPREIAMLAYPGMFPLDLIGPHSVLSSLPNTRVQIVGKSKT